MSNLTPDDVDVKFTAVTNKLTEEDTRLWEGLEDEKVSRIAGDEANKQFAQQVQGENQGTESRLSTEVIHRAEGDINNITSLNALAQAMSEYRIKTDLEIANEKIARQQLGVELDTKINNFVASWDHTTMSLYSAIQAVQDDVNNKHYNMDKRIRKYEDMLQDITTDSIQITMDNGEINMGAWTILSQAREWDLEIIGMFKDYKVTTDKTIDEAIKDIENKIPISEEIIKEALDQLSQSPIIKELDKEIGGLEVTIDGVTQTMMEHRIEAQNQMVNISKELGEQVKAETDARAKAIQEEAAARLEAVKRESAIRQQQLIQESADRTAEIDEKLKDVWINIDEETAERLKQIEQLQDGLTQEIIDRKEGDKSVLQVVDNYKASTDNTLANVQESIKVVADEASSNTTKITALDGRLTINEGNTNTAITNSALALEKAATSIDANTVTAGKVTALESSMTKVQEGLTTKADAKALTDLSTKVITIDGKVEANSTKIDQVATGLETANGNIAGNTSAISALQSKTTEMDGKITTVASDVTKLQADVKTVQNDLTTKASVQAVEDLTVRVQTTEQGVAANTSKITNLESSVNTMQGELASKVDSTAFNALSSKVDVQGSAIESQGQAITSVGARIDGLRNGGVNLITGAGQWNAVGVVGGTMTPSLSADKLILSINVVTPGWHTNHLTSYMGNAVASLNAGDEFVYSMDVFIEEGSELKAPRVYYNGGLSYEPLVIIPGQVARAGVWQRYYHKRVYNGGGFAIHFNYDGMKGNYKFRLPVMERGNIPSDWSLSTNDVASSTALQTLDAKVTKVDEKVTANSSAITALKSDVIDVKNDLATKASTSALNSLTTKVERINGVTTTNSTQITALNSNVSSLNNRVTINSSSINSLTASNKVHGDQITSLNDRTSTLQTKVNDVEAGLAANVTATNNLKTQVDKNGSDITVLTQSTTSLKAQLDNTRAGGDNLLKKSNVLQQWDSNNPKYPHAVYELSEPWVEGETYTLTYCVYHKPVKGGSNQMFYAGGGLQAIIGDSNTTDRFIRTHTFVKNSQNIDNNVLHVYHINNSADLTAIARVYWAVLTRGKNIGVTNWSPCNADTIDALANTASSEALQSLSAKVDQVDGKTTALADQITVLDSKVNNNHSYIVNNYSTKADTENAIATATQMLSASFNNSYNFLDIGLGSFTVESGGANVAIIDTSKNHFRVNMAWGEAGTFDWESSTYFKNCVDITKVKAGDTYTVSGFIRASRESIMRMIYVRIKNNDSRAYISDKPIGKGWYYFKITSQASTDVVHDLHNIIGAKLLNTNKFDWYEMRDVQAVLGSADLRYLDDNTASVIKTTEASVTTINGKIETQAKDIVTLSSSSTSGSFNYCKKPINTVGAVSNGITGFKWEDTIAYDVNAGNGNWVKGWLDNTDYWGVNGVYDHQYLVTLSMDVYLDDSPTAASNKKFPTAYFNNGEGYQQFRPVVTVSNVELRKWYRVYAVYTNKAPFNVITADHLGLGGCVGRILIKNLKMEVGSIATPYSADSIANKVSIQQTNEVVNGVKAVSTVSVNNNGFMSGYGLISKLVNGVVTSAFGVDADYFYVGKSMSNAKKPFMVLTSPQTIGGVTYPAGVWMDVAVIANATIGTAHIADASITNAKIKDLNADKITAGTINADRIGANSINAEKLTIGDFTNLWGNQYMKTNGARPQNTRTQWYGGGTTVPELKGGGVQMWGRDNIAPYSTRIPLKPGDTFVIEYSAGQNSGPTKALGVGLWVFDGNGGQGNSPFQYGAPTVIADLGHGWYRCRRTFVVNNNGSGQPAAYGCLYFQIEQGEQEANPAFWTVGDIVIRKQIGGELIVNGAITADKLYSNTVSGMFANFGEFRSTGADGSVSVMNSKGLTIIYPNGKTAIKIGIT